MEELNKGIVFCYRKNNEKITYFSKYFQKLRLKTTEINGILVILNIVKLGFDYCLF